MRGINNNSCHNEKLKNDNNYSLNNAKDWIQLSKDNKDREISINYVISEKV